MTEIDLTQLPKGQRQWQAFVDGIREVDDRAERYFLELKSNVPLSEKAGRAKVAKFILGAANRSPDQAAKRFAGHALLVLGVSQGAITGIPFFEAKDLERAVKNFIGVDGPGWDFEQVPVDADHSVIIVIVDPPQGSDVSTCRADGPEGLRDGAIYIRVDGETREAKGDEVRALLDRAKAAPPETELSVGIIGKAGSYHCDSAVLEEYVSRERDRHESAYRRANNDPRSHLSSYSAYVPSTSYMTKPEDRTYEEYQAEIATWESQTRAAWDATLDQVAGAAWSAIQLRVENLTGTFLEDVEVTVHLEGAVEGIKNVKEIDAFDFNKLPYTPRRWGPRRHDPYSSLYPTSSLPSTHYPSFKGPSAISFKNSGSVDLTCTLGDLRPKKTWLSDDDDLVLVVRDPELEVIRGTWRVTVRGHHKVYEGELSVEVDAVRDFSRGMRNVLKLDLGEDNNEDNA